MNIYRNPLGIACAILSLMAFPAAAQEAGYPSRLIKIVVPFPVGSFTDVAARGFAERASKTLGQPIIIDNKPGVNGVLGAKAVMAAPPDGYTILINSNSHAANWSTFKVPPYDPLKDFAPIARLVGIPLVLMVRPDLPVNTVGELTALAKRQPGKLTFGAGNTSSRAASELLKITAGVDLHHIPYKGVPQAVTDLMGGQIDMLITDTSYLLAQGDKGRLRGIAMTTPQRIAQLPNIPTFAESGVPNFELIGWLAAFAPAGTPPEIVRKLNQALVQAANDPGMKELLERLGTYSSPSSPDGLASFVTTETAKWARIQEAAAIEKQ